MDNRRTQRNKSPSGQQSDRVIGLRSRNVVVNLEPNDEEQLLQEEQSPATTNYNFPRNINRSMYRNYILKILWKRRCRQIGVSQSVWIACSLFLIACMVLYLIKCVEFLFVIDLSSNLDLWDSRRNLWFNMDSSLHKFILVPFTLVIILIVSPTPNYPFSEKFSAGLSVVFIVQHFVSTYRGAWTILWLSSSWLAIHLPALLSYFMLFCICYISLLVLTSVTHSEPVWFMLSRTCVVFFVMYVEGYIDFLYLCAVVGIWGEYICINYECDKYLKHVIDIQQNRRSQF